MEDNERHQILISWYSILVLYFKMCIVLY